MQNVDGSITVRAEMMKPLHLTDVEMAGRSFRSRRSEYEASQTLVSIEIQTQGYSSEQN